jgi:hypothetical protein
MSWPKQGEPLVSNSKMERSHGLSPPLEETLTTSLVIPSFNTTTEGEAYVGPPTCGAYVGQI